MIRLLFSYVAAIGAFTHLLYFLLGESAASLLLADVLWLRP